MGNLGIDGRMLRLRFKTVYRSEELWRTDRNGGIAKGGQGSTANCKCVEQEEESRMVKLRGICIRGTAVIKLNLWLIAPKEVTHALSTLTDSMVYGTRRFNDGFIRDFQ